MTRLRLLIASAWTFVVFLALAAPAFAGKGGEGLYGKTDDKVVTNFAFGLIIFFPLLITALSVGLYLLDRRKQHK